MNEDSPIASLFTAGTRTIDTLDLVIAVCLPFLLAFVITTTYRRTQRTNNYSVAFLHAIFLFSSLVSIVTLIVGNNVTSAFGMIGALSIIRFRNALKSPLDAIYIFWALVVGMACGTGFYFAAILLTGICALFALVLDLTKYGEPAAQDSILKILTNGAADESATQPAIEKALGAHVKAFRRVNVLFNTEENLRTYVYMLRTGKKSSATALQAAIGGIPGIERIHHLNSEAPAFVQ